MAVGVLSWATAALDLGLSLAPSRAPHHPWCCAQPHLPQKLWAVLEVKRVLVVQLQLPAPALLQSPLAGMTHTPSQA